MLSSSFFASKESEIKWRNYMTRTYKTPLGTEVSGPSIFQLPKRLKDTKLEAYHPRILGLGPFHHCRPDLPEKLLVIRRSALPAQYLEFEGAMEFMKSLSEPSFEEIVQSCYSSCFDLDWETLMLIMIVDSACLLGYLFALQEFVPQSKEEEEENRLLVSDIMMLENQIPYALVERVFQYANKGNNFFQENYVFYLFYYFLREISPVKLADDDDDYYSKEILHRPPKHLLHLMHSCVVGRKLLKSISGSAGEITPEAAAEGEAAPPNMMQLLRDCAKYAGRQGKDLFQLVIGEINSETSAAKARRLKVPGWFENTVQGLAQAFSDKERDSVPDVHSVSELYDIPKITFRALPQGFGFGNIHFDKVHKVISLPMTTLNSNSEVILRNLLAFEAEYVDSPEGTSSGVRDHIGLMCAIIRNKRDLQLLKDDAKIIESQLEDKDVIELFKSIKKSMDKLGKKSNLIDPFRKYTDEDYENVPIVKACKWIKKWVLALVDFVKRVWPVSLVLLLFLQTFCEIYDCRRGPWFGRAVNVGETEAAGLLTPRKFLRYYS